MVAGAPENGVYLSQNSFEFLFLFKKSGITYENKIKIYMPNCPSKGDEIHNHNISYMCFWILCTFLEKHKGTYDGTRFR
jgi:hypothetical protein